MSETANSGAAGTPVDPPPTPEPEGKEPTSYMVLWSEVPEDPRDGMAWREIGWYNGHSAGAAAIAARNDVESGAYAQMFDAGKRGGVKVRAIAKRSWPDDVEIHAIALRPEWSTKGEG